MRQVLSLLTLGIALAILGGAADPVWADDVVMLADTEELTSQVGTQTLLGMRALDDGVLAGQRGGADAHLSDLRAVGSVKEVAVSDAVTGHNIISGGALAGASGMPMFIQNSGNGVLIQNAVILNVDMN